MSQLSLAVKPAIINSFQDYPVQFITQAAVGTVPFQTRTSDPAAAATATSVFIAGFSEIELSNLRYVRVVKPVNGVKNVISVDATDATQLTVATGLVKGDIIVFKLEIQSTDSRGEFASMDTRETRYQPPFEYICVGNDTAAMVLAGLAKQLTLAKTLFPEADGAGEPYTVAYDATAKKLTVTALDCHLILKLEVDDLFQDNAAQVPVFAPVTVAAQFEGRGTFVLMRSMFHETEGSNEIDSHSHRTNLPHRGALYTQIQFGTRTERPDLSGNGAASQEIFQKPDFCLYVAENAGNDATLDALITFFNRATTTDKAFIAGDVPGTATTALLLDAAAIPVADLTTEDPENV